MNQVLSIVKLLRPQQWLKNGFVFLPIFFHGSLWNGKILFYSFITFIAFCFIASSIYCLNDIQDIEIDRIHPEKRNRPLPSGKVSIKLAYSLIPLLVIGSLLITLFLPHLRTLQVSLVLIIYFILNIGYCLKLKKYSIIDVFIVSFGFVLRIIAGGLATDIWLSPWIILMTFLLALFMAFAKRRDDVVKYHRENIITRKKTLHYNLDYLNLVLGIIGAITIVCYILYTVSPEVMERYPGKYVYITTIFVLAGILRYLQVTVVDEKSGSPTKILIKDRFIQLCILSWLFVFLVIIYF